MIRKTYLQLRGGRLVDLRFYSPVINSYTVRLTMSIEEENAFDLITDEFEKMILGCASPQELSAYMKKHKKTHPYLAEVFLDEINPTEPRQRVRLRKGEKITAATRYAVRVTREEHEAAERKKNALKDAERGASISRTPEEIEAWQASAENRQAREAAKIGMREERKVPVPRVLRGDEIGSTRAEKRVFENDYRGERDAAIENIREKDQARYAELGGSENWVTMNFETETHQTPLVVTKKVPEKNEIGAAARAKRKKKAIDRESS
jgi:hypothetical protein